MNKKKQAIIIVVYNQKGGCTKTATSMQLGGALAAVGFKTAIADLDPQITATLWSMQTRPNRPEFPARVASLAALGTSFLDKLGPLMEANDFIILDCPPAIDSDVPWTALLVADLAIIPVVPVMDNVWASKIAEELFFKAQEQRLGDKMPGELKGVFLLQQQRRGNVFEVCEEVLRQGARLPILETKIALRNIYPESQLFGTHVSAMGKSAAAEEITSFRDEVLKLLKVKIPKTVRK